MISLLTSETNTHQRTLHLPKIKPIRADEFHKRRNRVIQKKIKNKKGGFKFSAKNKKHVTDTASILDKTFNLKLIIRNEFKFPTSAIYQAQNLGF